MSSTEAFLALAWLFLALLYLGFARLLAEVTAIKRASSGPRRIGATIPETAFLPAGLPQSAGVALVLDTSCSTCLSILQLAREHLRDDQFVILTYQDPTVWTTLGVPADLVVEDSQSWASFAPLSVPVLAQIGADGKLGDVRAPVNEAAAESVLKSWATQLGVSSR